MTIPNNVTSIGDNAFNHCTDLTGVTISNSITTIGKDAFKNCTSLASIIVDNGNQLFDSRDDCNAIIETKTNILLVGCKNTIIPNGVTSIGDKAFENCIGLTDIIIPNSVTSIGDEAFKNCIGLTSFIIPNSVTTVGHSVFILSGLHSLTIGSGVLTIDGIPSGDCKIIWLPNTPPTGIEDIKYNPQYQMHYIPNDSYNEIIHKDNRVVYPFLSSIFEVDGVKYVPTSPSERTCDAIDCTYNKSIDKITIGKTVSYKGIDMTVKNVNKYIFNYNPYIKNIELSFDSGIGDYAFQGCTNLTTVTLGKEITSIGQYTFNGCKMLQEIIIPDAVTSIGGNAFEGCISMKSAKIGTGITEIKNYTFEECNSLIDIQIGSNVANIGLYAFKDCSMLPTIQIPESVINIKSYAFSGCKNLKTVIINDHKTELKIGSNGSNSLFIDCPLDSVYIGRNISYSTDKKYGYSPFYRNTSLRSVTIMDKETEISPNEFYGCTNLKNVSIGEGVTTIGDWAFSGCSSLDYFSFGSSVKTIGKEAFSDCTSMTRLISRASTPPTCGSQALDDINKWNCTLSVPIGAKTVYQQANQWKDFFFINDDVTSISKITNTIAAPNQIYDLNGKKLKEPSKGINIIGRKKVVMK